MYASLLRHELCCRNAAYAISLNLAHVSSYGETPVIVYKPLSSEKQHGNFLDATYAVILQRENWKRRLEKIHSQGSHSLPLADQRWKELDSSMSSDALLMNIFCHTDVLPGGTVASLLGASVEDVPEFGFKPRVPMLNRRTDRTEVDMKLGKLLVEAKLTETDFQVKPLQLIESYRDLDEVFDRDTLPTAAGQIISYQLIRNVLAAHALALDFCLLLDARRPDLIEAWYTIAKCIRIPELRTRCKLLTWQELSEVLPEDLRRFLDLKYGIVPPGSVPSIYKGEII